MFYLLSSALHISLNFPFICVLSFLSFRAMFCSINPDDVSPNYSGLARVYCILITLYVSVYHHVIQHKLCIFIDSIRTNLMMVKRGRNM
jgi:hypothetical protein